MRRAGCAFLAKPPWRNATNKCPANPPQAAKAVIKVSTANAVNIVAIGVSTEVTGANIVAIAASIVATGTAAIDPTVPLAATALTVEAETAAGKLLKPPDSKFTKASLARTLFGFSPKGPITRY